MQDTQYTDAGYIVHRYSICTMQYKATAYTVQSYSIYSTKLQDTQYTGAGCTVHRYKISAQSCKIHSTQMQDTQYKATHYNRYSTHFKNTIDSTRTEILVHMIQTNDLLRP